MGLRVTNNIAGFVGATQVRAARGMTQALVLGAAEASVMTPIDTSNLLNSQYKHVRREGNAIVGRVGYTADYALPVHDPEHHQNFRRASARKEFLKLGFERAEPNISAVLRGSIKT